MTAIMDDGDNANDILGKMESKYRIEKRQEIWRADNRMSEFAEALRQAKPEPVVAAEATCSAPTHPPQATAAPINPFCNSFCLSRIFSCVLSLRIRIFTLQDLRDDIVQYTIVRTQRTLL